MQPPYNNPEWVVNKIKECEGGITQLKFQIETLKNYVSPDQLKAWRRNLKTLHKRLKHLKQIPQ